MRHSIRCLLLYHYYYYCYHYYFYMPSFAKMDREYRKYGACVLSETHIIEIKIRRRQLIIYTYIYSLSDYAFNFLPSMIIIILLPMMLPWKNFRLIFISIFLSLSFHIFALSLLKLRVCYFFHLGLLLLDLMMGFAIDCSNVVISSHAELQINLIDSKLIV